MAKHPDDRVIVYVGGDGVTPTTIEPQVALELAGAYFDLMQKVAEDHDQELGLLGLEVIPGSVGLASRSRFPKVARGTADEVDELLAGSAEPVSGRVEKAYSRLARTLEGLPDGHWARAAVAGTKPRSLLAARAPSETPELWSVTSLRATPFKVGGRVPKVWFRSGSEAKPFGVTATEKEAREVAHHLYDEVEVTFRFVRDEDGAISDGVLQSFRPVAALPDELAAWRAWFNEAGAHLVDVDDVDDELSRDGEE